MDNRCQGGRTMIIFFLFVATCTYSARVKWRGRLRRHGDEDHHHDVGKKFDWNFTDLMSSKSSFNSQTPTKKHQLPWQQSPSKPHHQPNPPILAMAFPKIIPFLGIACLLHLGGFHPASAQEYRDRPARTLSFLFGSSKTSTIAPPPSPPQTFPPTDPPTPLSPTNLPSISSVLRTPQLQQRHHSQQLIQQQPSQPILYNIRFYPDLSYQQTLQDRVKDKPSGYSFQQQVVQPQPVCPYANLHEYKIPVTENISSPPSKQQTQPAPAPTASTPVSPPSPATHTPISPTAFTPKLLNTRPQEAQPVTSTNYILPLESQSQQEQPYLMTQQEGGSSAYLPVLQAAAAAVSQQHQLAQLFQSHQQQPYYYQPPQAQFPYYTQQFLTSQQQQQPYQRGQQQVSSQKLAPSVYNEYPQYYYYPEYVYVVPVLPQSSPQQQQQTQHQKQYQYQPQYPYSVQSFNSNWNTVEDMTKRLREGQKQTQAQVKGGEKQ